MSHRANVRSALLAVLLQCMGVASAQQPVQPQEQQAPASLEGTVIRAGSGPPAAVPRARVVLSVPAARGITIPAPLTVVSDDAGHFFLRDIPPGTYNVMATRDGYVRASKPITLAERESMTNVILEMTPTSAISGRLRNQNGDPVANATVQAQRYTYREGRRALTNVQSAITNDLGEYRLYYLPAGRYIISATPAGGPRLQQGPGNTTYLLAPALPGTPQGGLPLTGAPELVGNQYLRASAMEFLSLGLLPSSLTGAAYVPAYFPGTMDPSAATPIDLAPGRDFTNADFIVSESRARRIRGRVVNGLTGEPASGATLFLLSTDIRGDLRPARQNGSVGADGTFELAAVPPGAYDLVAMVGKLPPDITYGGSGYPGGGFINPGPPGMNHRDYSADPTGIRLAARVPIVVGGSDIDNLVVTAQVGYTIRGRVVIEGASVEESRRQLEGVVVQLMPVSYDFETGAMPAVVRPDGTFTVVGALPGTYQICLMGAANMQNGLVYIKSAMLGAVDVINPRFVIASEPLGELEIVVSTARGNAAVSVVDAKQAPAPSVTVVFVPDMALRQHYDLYRGGLTGSNGIAQMVMAPGDYTAYAFENIESGSWWDPEVLQKYAGLGTPVRVEPNGKHQLQLKSIPPR